MTTYTIVRPEHLNHHGTLFGGQLLKWVDEYAWLAAARDFPECRLVTRAMDNIEFRHPVPLGSILRFQISLVTKGATSTQYSVLVHADSNRDRKDRCVFSTNITFVHISEDGRKVPLPEPVQETAEHQ